MEEVKEFECVTGMARVPSPLGASVDVSAALTVKEEDLPEDYIVPRYRHWFDAEFRPIREKMYTLPDGRSLQLKRDGSPDEFNQAHVGKCTDMGMAIQKASIENRPVSTRDGWRRTKELDFERYGRPKSAYGAMGWSAADAFVEGIADEELVPSQVLPTENDLTHQNVVETEAIKESRKRNRGEKSYIVYRPDFRRAMFETGHPIVTHVQWFSRDNEIGRNGNSPFMTMPEGSDAGGHMFGGIGWLSAKTIERITGFKIPAPRALVFPNSWTRYWGFCGLFFVTQDGVFNRLGPEAWVHVDAGTVNLAEILAKYEGKDVRVPGKPEHYRIQGGKVRHYADAYAWFAAGKIFGFEVADIDQHELEAIPKGAELTIEDADWHGRELLRQIRQTMGLK